MGIQSILCLPVNKVRQALPEGSGQIAAKVGIVASLVLLVIGVIAPCLLPQGSVSFYLSIALTAADFLVFTSLIVYLCRQRGTTDQNIIVETTKIAQPIEDRLKEVECRINGSIVSSTDFIREFKPFFSKYSLNDYENTLAHSVPMESVVSHFKTKLLCVNGRSGAGSLPDAIELYATYESSSRFIQASLFITLSCDLLSRAGWNTLCKTIPLANLPDTAYFQLEF